MSMRELTIIFFIERKTLSFYELHSRNILEHKRYGFMFALMFSVRGNCRLTYIYKNDLKRQDYCH